MKTTALLKLLLLFALAQTANATTYFVATNGNDTAAGTNWFTARQTIQAAIDLTVSNDTVFVSNGVYATGGRVVFGAMTNRVAITNAITVQSVSGPQVTIIGGTGPIGDNAVRCVYAGPNSYLSGFTLTNGATRASINGVKEAYGGGVWCASSAVISNCIISGNSCAMDGGGSYFGVLIDCSLAGNVAGRNGGGACTGRLERCTLSDNFAAGTFGTSGGGGAYFATLIDCTLASNSTPYHGGGACGGSLDGCILSGNSTILIGGGASFAVLNNCILNSNAARHGGGGTEFCTVNNSVFVGNTARIAAAATFGLLNNCLFVGNFATNFGGAIFPGTANNCIVVGNIAGDYGGGVMGTTQNNCIIQFNVAPQDPNYSTNSLMNYCCTSPMPTNGAGNITNDPQFVDAANSNLHLKASSPCINAGNNAYAQGSTDLDGRPRIVGDTVDMGAYEYGYHFVAITCTNPVPPYSSWATAATNIQDAIDVAVSNDTVLVSNGVYATGGRFWNGVTNRVVLTNAITMQSANGAAVTTIGGSGPSGGSAVRCAYVTAGCAISGFTLTKGATSANSDDTGSGGGVFCETNLAMVCGCVLAGNQASYAGGGACYGTLNNCILSGNASFLGGGSYFGSLNNSKLSGNSAFMGGASYDGTLNNCTLSGNSATFAGGGAVYGTLNNCIVYFNTADFGANNYSGSTLVQCCAPALVGAGNITNNPQFVDAANSNFHLKATSRCIDRGNNAYATNTTTDLDGNPRIMYGVVDMGAFEAQFPIGYWTWIGAITNGLTNLTDCATGDGYPNLLKYATGSSPTNSDNLAAMSGTPTTNGFFALNFSRNTNANDITLIAEGNYDLTNSATWNGIATNIHGSWGATANYIENTNATPAAVTVWDTDATATNRFLRLRVTRP